MPLLQRILDVVAINISFGAASLSETSFLFASRVATGRAGAFANPDASR
jgi:hypothetical protein